MGYPESVSRVESLAWASFHMLGFQCLSLKSRFFGLPGCLLMEVKQTSQRALSLRQPYGAGESRLAMKALLACGEP
jgi:hypothetical protein